MLLQQEIEKKIDEVNLMNGPAKPPVEYNVSLQVLGQTDMYHDKKQKIIDLDHSKADEEPLLVNFFL